VSESGERGAESGPSTASLLIRARSGDAPAREALATRYIKMLGRWAHGRVPHTARDLIDTDDLVQQTLVRAFNNLEGFESRGEGAFVAYLRQILLNQIRDQSRRAKRRPEHVELDESYEESRSESPLEQAIGRDRLRDYEAALARLGEGQRHAVILRLEMGMRYREIAEALDIPNANAARSLVGRGMANIAGLMRDHHEAE